MPAQRRAFIFRAPIARLAIAASGLEDTDVPLKNIVYQDLVFTLKYSPSKSPNLLVLRDKSGPLVIRNHVFAHAAKDAGNEWANFQMLRNHTTNEGLEGYMEAHGIDLTHVNPDSTSRFFFFQNLPEYIDTGIPGVVTPFQDNLKPEFREAHCLAYHLKAPPMQMPQIEEDLVERLSRLNGRLRSVNGIRNMSPHEKYF